MCIADSCGLLLNGISSLHFPCPQVDAILGSHASDEGGSAFKVASALSEASAPLGLDDRNKVGSRFADRAALATLPCVADVGRQMNTVR